MTDISYGDHIGSRGFTELDTDVMATPKHISIPKTFSSGDVDEWFCRFEICSTANEWNAATKATKLPTLLEGEALAVWLELSVEDKEDYTKAKKAIKSKLLPPAFSALDRFNRRFMLPGETLNLYVHELKRLLQQAMPDLQGAAKEQLLLHQFLTGLPPAVSRQLRSTGETTELEATVQRARLIMTVEKELAYPVEQHSVAPVEHREQDPAKQSEVLQLKTQIAELTQQVAALTVQAAKRQSPAPARCFFCHEVGHIQRFCPSLHNYQSPRDNRRCFRCGRMGHVQKDCRQQGND